MLRVIGDFAVGAATGKRIEIYTLKTISLRHLKVAEWLKTTACNSLYSHRTIKIKKSQWVRGNSDWLNSRTPGRPGHAAGLLHVGHHVSSYFGHIDREASLRDALWAHVFKKATGSA